jgi:heptaprenyl diphosphate synthase
MDTVLAQFSEYLNDVEQNLATSIERERTPPVPTEASSECLIDAAKHLCIGSGGKRARPLLVKIFGLTCGAPASPLVDVGVAAEMIHSASLLHDDVVDGGMFRRGRPTVNARWGNIVAVMSGDLLLSTALMKLSHLDPLLTRTAIATVAEMTRAAIAEVEVRGDLSISQEKLRAIAEGKTGSLFGWCGRAAAIVGGDPEAADRFDRFGRMAGVAFQIADDVRDLAGTDEGKPQYADVQSRTPSVPILIAAARDEGLRKRLREAWAFSAMTPDRVRELGTAVLCSGAVELAIEKMNAEIDAAVEALGEYANRPTGIELVGWARKLAQGMVVRGAA